MQQKNQLLSQEILALDEKISDLQFHLQGLKSELANLDEDTLMPHWEKRTGVQFNKAVIGLSILGGFVLGAVVGAASFHQEPVPIVLMTLGGGALATGLTWLRRYLQYTLFEYKGLPFEHVSAESSVGEFEVLECSKERGIYRAKFYGDLRQYAEPKVTISLKKNTIPSNVERIKSIRLELYQGDIQLKEFENEKAGKVAAKKQNTQQQVLSEAAAKKEQRSSMGRPSYSTVPFQMPAASASAKAPAPIPSSVETTPDPNESDNFFPSLV